MIVFRYNVKSLVFVIEVTCLEDCRGQVWYLVQSIMLAKLEIGSKEHVKGIILYKQDRCTLEPTACTRTGFSLAKYVVLDRGLENLF